MGHWSLSVLLAGMHNDVQQRLDTARKSFGHPDATGDASEKVWLEFFDKYLPQRYQSASAYVVDSKGEFSQQIDIVIFDRHYSPFIFDYEGQKIIPAESVYAVFEAKQSINAKQTQYAQEKIASVRKLYRTSLPIPHAGGTYPAKPQIKVLGGILTFESDWNPPLGDFLLKALEFSDPHRRIDLGCIAAHGTINYLEASQTYELKQRQRSATAFLFELISRLQDSGTVPMIDIGAYAVWLGAK